MQSDEDEIRELVAKWMKATKEGDSETVLSLMADDCIFIVPGQPPFGKEAFASAANSQDAASMKINGESEVLEITVTGDWAFMLSHLTVKVKVEGSPEMVRAGNTLTVLTKRDGYWLLYRDANLLVSEQQSSNAT